MDLLQPIWVLSAKASSALKITGAIFANNLASSSVHSLAWKNQLSKAVGRSKLKLSVYSCIEQMTYIWQENGHNQCVFHFLLTTLSTRHSHWHNSARDLACTGFALITIKVHHMRQSEENNTRLTTKLQPHIIIFCTIYYWNKVSYFHNICLSRKLRHCSRILQSNCLKKEALKSQQFNEVSFKESQTTKRHLLPGNKIKDKNEHFSISLKWYAHNLRGYSQDSIAICKWQEERYG